MTLTDIGTACFKTIMHDIFAMHQARLMNMGEPKMKRAFPIILAIVLMLALPAGVPADAHEGTFPSHTLTYGNFKMTVTAGPGGKIYATGFAGRYNFTNSDNFDYVFKAIPEDGSTFVRWEFTQIIYQGRNLYTPSGETLTINPKKPMTNFAATAIFEASTCPITFDAGAHGNIGGKQQDSIQVQKGEMPTAPTVDADANWTFAGWSPVLATVTGSTTYTAQYSPIMHTVTFDAGAHGNIGGKQQDSMQVQQGEMPAAPTVETDANWTFTGWCPVLATVTGSTTYTAQYSAIMHAIMFDAGAHGNIEGEPQKSIEVQQGEMPTAPTVETDANWTFAGWSPVLATVTGSTTYTAQYSPVMHAITFDAGAHGNIGGNQQDSIQVQQGEMPTTPTVDADANWKFAGWSPVLATVTGSTTYTAQYSPVMHAITFDAGAHGNIGGNQQDSIQVQQGEMPTAPTVETDTNWKFAGWSPVLATVTGSITYTAQYSAIMHAIMFDAGAHGNIGGKQQDSVEVQQGEMPTGPTVETDANWTFAGWSPDVVTVAGPATYTAQYSPIMHTVTFDAGAHGRISGLLQMSIAVQQGSLPPALAAEADVNWTFTGWSPVLSAVCGNVNYTAQYTPVISALTGACVIITPHEEELAYTADAPNSAQRAAEPMSVEQKTPGISRPRTLAPDRKKTSDPSTGTAEDSPVAFKGSEGPSGYRSELTGEISGGPVPGTRDKCGSLLCWLLPAVCVSLAGLSAAAIWFLKRKNAYKS
jgi:hypothetical protein